MSLKIAIVADIHHGKESTSKKGESALSLMAAFALFRSGFLTVMNVGHDSNF